MNLEGGGMQTFGAQEKSWRELLNVANILKVLLDELEKERSLTDLTKLWSEQPYKYSCNKMQMLETGVEAGLAENQELCLRHNLSFHLDIQFERGIGGGSV